MDEKKGLLAAIRNKNLQEPFSSNLVEFIGNYLEALTQSGKNIKSFFPLIEAYIELVEKNTNTPFHFPPFHKIVKEPFDHSRLGIDFWLPLIDRSSSVFFGKEPMEAVHKYLENGENVIFLSNHQSEADPKVLSVHFQETYPKIASETIYIAGHRVTSDPISIPFSMGLNLLCIYSKRRIDSPPELREYKTLHNRRAMQILQSLLEEGGRSIYVAPSGGRDRKDSNGFIDVAPFDPASIEMFRLIALQAKTPTHFFPLSLYSYDLLPPPPVLHSEMVEVRLPKYTPVHLYIGEELDFSFVPEEIAKDKKQGRIYRSNLAYDAVRNNYLKLLKLANA